MTGREQTDASIRNEIEDKIKDMLRVVKKYNNYIMNTHLTAYT